MKEDVGVERTEPLERAIGLLEMLRMRRTFVLHMLSAPVMAARLSDNGSPATAHTAFDGCIRCCGLVVIVQESALRRASLQERAFGTRL